MKISRAGFLTVSLLLLLLASCNKTEDACAFGTPTCSCAYIGIVDGDGNSLLGPANVYKPTEISLSNDGQIIELLTDDLGGEDFYLKFFLNDIISNEDYFLQLNDSETDILNFDIKVNEGGCYVTFSIQKFRVNGTEIMTNGEIYLIEK